MKISQEIIIGLKRLANSSLVSEENLDKLILESSSYLKNPQTHQIGIAHDTPKIDILKECFAALMCLLLESVRNNLEADALKSFLESYKFTPQRLERILKLYLAHKVVITNCLSKIKTEPPHIYDVTWKLNMCIKSSFSDLEEKLVYVIDLHMCKSREKGKPRVITQKLTFICTIHHLQELVWKLKAAVRQLEAISNFGR